MRFPWRDAAALAFLASALICGAIVYLRPYHQRYSIDALSDFPQKIHRKATPRLGGIGEDLLKKVSTVARLLLTFAGAAIADFALDARITTLDLPGSDYLLGISFLSLAFTMFAVGGFAHALLDTRGRYPKAAGNIVKA
jgi:UDP-N-acetylmuramyl pentapeptide phosphotransferase/UDP-N-acetylglucosamine-1-phosphate transferase